jgi:hypothetical protein
MKLWFFMKRQWIFWLAARLPASQKGLSFMALRARVRQAVLSDAVLTHEFCGGNETCIHDPHQYHGLDHQVSSDYIIFEISLKIF